MFFGGCWLRLVPWLFWGDCFTQTVLQEFLPEREMWKVLKWHPFWWGMIYIYIGWFLWIQGVPGMKHVEAPLLYPHILIIWFYDIPSTIVLFLGRHCPDEWSTCWGGQDGSLDIGLLGSIGFLYSFFRKAGSLLKKVWFSFALVIPDIIIGLRYHARLGKAPS